jgi:hypothetical protein
MIVYYKNLNKSLSNSKNSKNSYELGLEAVYRKRNFKKNWEESGHFGKGEEASYI